MTGRTRVKICGITRLEDALHAAHVGADALGFVFVPASKRCIGLDAAAAMLRQLPAFVTPVGLFLDAPASEVRNALDLMPSLVPQFHGVESAEVCEAFGRPYYKALGLGDVVASGNPNAALVRTVEEEAARYPGALGFLLDSHAPGALGGTGIALDWQALGDVERALGGRSLILAGGLTPESVGQAIGLVKPWAVDVSSGVERAKGIKDSDAVARFMQAVAVADDNRVASATA